MKPDDPTLTRAERVLTALPRHEPRQAHAEQLRAQCHQQLARQRPARPIALPAIERSGRALVRTALACALGLVYPVAVVRRALHCCGL